MVTPSAPPSPRTPQAAALYARGTGVVEPFLGLWSGGHAWRYAYGDDVPPRHSSPPLLGSGGEPEEEEEEHGAGFDMFEWDF